MSTIRRLSVFAILAVAPVMAQFSSTASHIRFGTSLPATCNVKTGDVYFLVTGGTSGTAYQCTAANTWSVIGGGGPTTRTWAWTWQGSAQGYAAGWPVYLPPTVNVAPTLNAGTVVSLSCGASCGSGGTSGTTALTFTGSYSTAPVGTCTVSGGAITALAVTSGGTGVSSIATVTCGSSGLTSATITATLSTMPVATLDWPLTQSTYYAWWTFFLPSGYTSNAAISYRIESRSWDSTHAANAYLSLGCVATGSTIENPTLVEGSAIPITGAASNGTVVTTGTITPNAGGLPACAASNRVFLKMRVDTNANSLTNPFELISFQTSVTGAM